MSRHFIPSRPGAMLLAAILAAAPAPAGGQASPSQTSPPSVLRRLAGLVGPDAITASYHGTIGLASDGVNITGIVRSGRVTCTGHDGEQQVYGTGRIDLELGLRGNQQYRFSFHCPPPRGFLTAYGVDRPTEDHAGSLKDYGNSYEQPGGTVVRDPATGDLRGPELLKGTWSEDGETFTWSLCRRCAPPPPPPPPAPPPPP